MRSLPPGGGQVPGGRLARSSQMATDLREGTSNGLRIYFNHLRSIDLSAFKDAHPLLVHRIKELQPDASNRAIAAAVGVDESTVRADLKPPAGNPAPEAEDNPSDTGESADPAGNPAPEPPTKDQLLAQLKAHGIDMHAIRDAAKAEVEKTRREAEETARGSTMPRRPFLKAV